MSNRILTIGLRDRSAVPAEAEVHVTVVPRFIDTGTEVRGRLMGPRCRFASTVEVAYHLKRILVPTSVPAFTLKAIIPEASLWEPESPHLYSGPIELWQDGVRCEVVPVRHGLRHVGLGRRGSFAPVSLSSSLGVPRSSPGLLPPLGGLRLNSKPIRLKGRTVSACSDEEALALREFRCNLLLTPVSEESRHVWEVADRLGFFVLGLVKTRAQARLTQHLTGQVSCLGWVVAGEEVRSGDLAPAALLGIEAGKASASVRANFVLGSAETLIEETSLPVLLLGGGGEVESESGPIVLGTVEGEGWTRR